MSDRDTLLVALCVGTFLGAASTFLLDFAVSVWRHHQQQVAKQRRRQVLQARLDAVQRQSGAWWE